MDFGVYSVFDSKSAIYDRVWQAVSDPAAIRSFTDIALDATHPIGMHPEDYSLFKVGMFDDNTGALMHCDPKCIARAHELVAASRVVDSDKVVQLDKEIASAS